MKIQSPTSKTTGLVGKLSRSANIILVLAILLFVASGWAWWHYVRSNPENTFYGMINNSLRTRGVTREISQKSGEQELLQTIQLSLGSQPVAFGETQVMQGGAMSASVHTENISTPKNDFVRYTKVETDQKNAKGETIDFKSLLNLWGRTDFQADGQGAGELYSESVLGVVPIGNLGVQQRHDLMKLIRDNKVYQFDENKVNRSIKDGRPVYVYSVSVAPEAYVTMLKQFASAMGMKQFETVDPASYKNSQPISLELEVDVWSQQLTGINYIDSNRQESLGGHNVVQNVALPTEAISMEELQQRVQQLQ